MLRVLLLFCLISLSTEVSANNKDQIINKLKDTLNLNFDFEQNINGKIEFGNCTIQYPKKMFCAYDQKNKVIVSNGKSLVIKSTSSYYRYPLDKTPLNFILDKNFLKEACGNFPNKIALGLDAKDGYLSVSGWKENSNQLTLDYLKEVNEYGASRLIYTDINRDGMKQSPNFEETVKVADTSNCPVIISGGVSSINDIKKAKELNNKNIEGIIVGKAIYDGDIKLDELAKEVNA